MALAVITMADEQKNKRLRIKKLRDARNLSVSELSRKLLVEYGLTTTNQTIYNWESEQSVQSMSFEHLFALRDLFGLAKIDDLFEDDVSTAGED